MPFDSTPLDRTVAPATRTIDTELVAALVEARRLITKQQHWCQGQFALSLFGYPCDPESHFAIRRCGVGAIRAAARHDLDLQNKMCTAFNRFGMCLIGINDRRDQPKDAHAAVLAAYDKVIASLS